MKVLKKIIKSNLKILAEIINYLLLESGLRKEPVKIELLQKGKVPKRCLVTGNGRSYDLVRPYLGRLLENDGVVFCCNSFLYFERQLVLQYPDNFVYVLSDPISRQIIKDVSEGKKEEILSPEYLNVTEYKYSKYKDYFYSAFRSAKILFDCDRISFACPKSWEKDLPLQLIDRTVFFNDYEIIFPNSLNRIMGCLHHRSLTYPRNYTSTTAVKALAIAVSYGIEEIYISGMDTDYLKEIYADKSNKVIMTDRLFYNPQGIRYEFAGTMFEIHKAITKFIECLECCYPKSKFSRKIYNVQTESVLDVFEKRNFKDASELW